MPPPARASKDDDDPYEGWLFRKLTGQQAATEPATDAPLAGAPAAEVPGTGYPQTYPATDAANGVVPASAEQYMPPSPNPATQPTAGLTTSAQSPKLYPPPPAMVESSATARKPAFELEDLAPDKMYKSLRAATGYGPNEAEAKKQFQEGEAHFKQKQWDAAAKKFAVAAERWPDSLLEEDALFMLGESYFFADRYASAHDAYGRLLKEFDNTRYLDTVMERQFAIGRYWDQMHTKEQRWPVTPNMTDKTQPRFDTFNHALEAYQRVRMHDPTGKLADDAIMATANAYFLRERYEDAAYHYDQLRKEYPTSEFQAQAHVLGLQAKLRVYQGPGYDGAPLEDAQKITEVSLTQFGHELGEERARMEQAANELTEAKAEREWSMGQFYEKKRAYGASRFYYNGLIKEYPRTRHAEMARRRLEEIRDYPDVPPNRFKWLTGLFPGEE
ncbi:MAG: tetratricopeptide repeat protein [Planctomycetota bacterium]